MKKLFKITVLALCILVSLSSCTFIKSFFDEVKTEAENVAAFTEELVILMEEPSVEKAEELVHPNSPLTAESVIEKIENNEKLQNLDFSGEVSVGEVTNLNMSYHDEELGGNLYEAECQVTINGTTIDVTLKLLSTSEGFGLYDFDIK